MTKPNKQSINKLIDKLMKAVAFIALFTSAAYGCRKMLEAIQEPISIVVTSLLVVFLAYVVFKD